MQDKCCTIMPHFEIEDGRLHDLRPISICEEFIDLVGKEEKCLYYGFSFNGKEAHCGEAYADAEGVLVHQDNVGEKSREVLKI